MATPAPVTGTREDRQTAANFKIEFTGGGDDVLFATSVTGINMESRLAESRQGTSVDGDFSVVDSAYGEVTITGTQTSMNNSFLQWMTASLNGAPRAERQRTIRVIPLTPSGEEKPECWQLDRCNPRSYTPGDFDASSQDLLTYSFVVQPTRVRLIPTPGLQ